MENVPDDYHAHWARCPTCRQVDHPAEGGCLCESCEVCGEGSDPRKLDEDGICEGCLADADNDDDEGVE